MSSSRPPQRPAGRQDRNHDDRTTMPEPKFIPPPPLFLEQIDYGHGSRAEISSARGSHTHPQEHIRVYNDNFRAPPPKVSASDQSKRGQAVPIAALLTEVQPARNRQGRSDSLVSPTAIDTPPQQAPAYFTYGPPRGDLYRPGYGSPTSPSTNPHVYWQQRLTEPHPPPQSQPVTGHYHAAAPLSSHRPHRLSMHRPSPRSSSSRNTIFEPPSARVETTSQPCPASPPVELEYTLHMRQQPRAARACGNGDRDRRVIDPPPIIQVFARDPATGDSHIDSDSYTTLHCMLINAVTGRDESFVTVVRPDGSGGASTTQQLVGCAVASPWVGHDEHGGRGSFFVFSDLSVRQVGRYKLLFRLLKVNPLDMSSKGKNYIRATIESDIFEVFQAKEFPGMRASSALLKALRAQGLNVGVKKGSASAAGGGLRSKSGREQDEEGEGDGRGEDAEEDDDDDDDDSDGDERRGGAGSSKKAVPSRTGAELKKSKSVKRLRTA